MNYLSGKSLPNLKKRAKESEETTSYLGKLTEYNLIR